MFKPFIEILCENINTRCKGREGTWGEKNTEY